MTIYKPSVKENQRSTLYHKKNINQKMLTLTKEEAVKAVRGNHPRFKVVEKKWLSENKGIDRTWVILQDTQTGKHYEKYYHSGYRMSGGSGWDVHPFEREKPVFQEVELREVVIKKWVAVEENKGSS